MSDLPLKLMVRGQLAAEDGRDLVRKLMSEERGEMGSWMILAAGLAAAALTAVTALTTWFGKKTTAITSK